MKLEIEMVTLGNKTKKWEKKYCAWFCSNYCGYISRRDELGNENNWGDVSICEQYFEGIVIDKICCCDQGLMQYQF